MANDGPNPTIVGPRPDDDTGLRKDVPRGLEKLLTLAGISPDWRENILADPLGAAREAGIVLAPSEEAILGRIPRPALEAMAASFARKRGRPASPIIRRAAGVAAAALLAVNLSSSAGEPAPAAPGGVRADEPPARPTPTAVATPEAAEETPEPLPAIAWEPSLAAALARARRENRAVLAVFLHPDPATAFMQIEATPEPVAIAGVVINEPAEELEGPTPAELSQAVCLAESEELRRAVADADLLAVRVTRPERPDHPSKNALRRWRQQLTAYEAALQRYGIADSLPAVVFLAPDATELAKLTQPRAEGQLVLAAGTAAPLMAAWLTGQRTPQERPDAYGGVRADEPAPPAEGGVRADLPPVRQGSGDDSPVRTAGVRPH